MTAPAFPPDTALPCTVHPSPNHGDRRGQAIGSIVLHYMGMRSAAGALERLSDPAAEVSTHYLLDEDGRVFQLVPEARRAWHAGRSFWRGERDLNSVSVGIEIANRGHDEGLPPFPDRQIAAAIALCRDIRTRHVIPTDGNSFDGILGHSDIAPGRKVDPGPRFPWARLAEEGLGRWPLIEGLDAAGGPPSLAMGARGRRVAALQAGLCLWGMDAPTDMDSGLGIFGETTRVLVSAFQLRFRPACTDGVADGETVALLEALTQTCSRSSRDAWPAP